METDRYRIRYQPGTDLATRYPEATAADWPLDKAMEVLAGMNNRDHMELVPA